MAITSANAGLLPNGLGDIAPNLYSSVETVARELTGAIRAVKVNTGSDVAAVGSQITSFRTRAREAIDTVAGHTAPTVDAQEMDTPNLQITKSRTVPIRYTDAEMANFQQGDAYGFQAVLSNDIEQAFRSLTNEIDKEIIDTMMARRAYEAVPGTIARLFADNSAPTKTVASVRSHLNRVGAPKGQRCLIIGHTDAEALMANQYLAKVNEAGTSETLRDGKVARIGGFDIYESDNCDGVGLNVAASTPHASLAINLAAGYDRYDDTFVVDQSSNGAVAAGTVVKIGNFNYVVNTAKAAAGTSVNIRAPGLLEAAPDDTGVDAVAAHGLCFALHMNAFELAIRAPARPRQDNARDVMIVRDPESMIAFEIAEYAEHRQHHWEVTAVWGMQLWQREFLSGVAVSQYT